MVREKWCFYMMARAFQREEDRSGDDFWGPYLKTHTSVHSTGQRKCKVSTDSIIGK